MRLRSPLSTYEMTSIKQNPAKIVINKRFSLSSHYLHSKVIDWKKIDWNYNPARSELQERSNNIVFTIKWCLEYCNNHAFFIFSWWYEVVQWENISSKSWCLLNFRSIVCFPLSIFEIRILFVMNVLPVLHSKVVEIGVRRSTRPKNWKCSQTFVRRIIMRSERVGATSLQKMTHLMNLHDPCKKM